MRLRYIFQAWFFLAALGTVAIACDDSKKGECSHEVSKAGGDDSHNNGQNCMNCHFSGGKGEGCFTVAGSVYDNTKSNPVSGGTIKLHTGANGTGSVVATISVDGKGNFYTTDQINFSGGLYPSFTNAGGTTNFMGSVTTIGQCGSCHGVSTDKIFSP